MVMMTTTVVINRHCSPIRGVLGHCGDKEVSGLSPDFKGWEALGRVGKEREGWPAGRGVDWPKQRSGSGTQPGMYWGQDTEQVLRLDRSGRILDTDRIRRHEIPCQKSHFASIKSHPACALFHQGKR